MFSCPYQSYCGSDALQTIVPSSRGEPTAIEKTASSIDPATSSTFYFTASHVCRYMVKFPMDASYGDTITLNVKYTNDVKLITAIGSDFLPDKLAIYEFTSKNNGKNRFIKFPFPYRAYVTISSYKKDRG